MRLAGIYFGVGLGSVLLLIACGVAQSDHPSPAITSEREGGLSSGGGTKDSGSGDAGEGGTEGGASSGGLPFGGYDAKQIYLQGTLQEGAGGRGAVADILSPNAFVAVSPDLTRRTWIHPTDGFVYVDVDDKSVHKLVADPSPTRSADGKFWENFPMNPKANDTVITMSTCSTDVSDLFVRPDTGKYLHTCGADTKSLIDDAGQTVVTCNQVLTVGYGKGVLCTDQVFDDAGQSHPLTVIPDSGVAWRAKADGSFHVVTANGTGSATVYTLWNVPLTGVAVKVHDYAKLTGYNIVNADARGWILLDADANLYRWVNSSDGGTADLIAKLDATTATIVYDETNVWVKMHGSIMVSGP